MWVFCSSEIPLERFLGGTEEQQVVRTRGSIIYFKTTSKMQKLLKSNKYIKRYMQNNLYFLFKLFSIGDSFKLNATRSTRLI